MASRWFRFMYIFIWSLLIASLYFNYQFYEIYGELSPEKQAPSDIVKMAEYSVNNGTIVVTYKDVDNKCWDGEVISSKEYEISSNSSMIPTIAYGHQFLCLRLNSVECLNPGDIVVNIDNLYGATAHRIYEISDDDNGWYAKTWGDHNNAPDKEKLRASDKLCLVFNIGY